MSVESEILRIQRNIADAYSKVAEKGGEVPLQPTSENLAAAVESIPAGGGSAIIPGDGLSKDGDTINVDNPVMGIYTQEEFDALPEEQKAKGTYFVHEPVIKWWSPKMTANNAPVPYEAMASSSKSVFGSAGPYAAFDDDPNTYWANDERDAPPWIAIDFGEEKELFGLQMWARSAVSGQLPHTFVVQGSHNGTDWADVYSAENLPQDEAGIVREFPFPEPVVYRYYRITNMKSYYRFSPESTVDTYIGIANIRFQINTLNLLKITANGKTLVIQWQKMYHL